MSDDQQLSSHECCVGASSPDDPEAETSHRRPDEEAERDPAGQGPASSPLQGPADAQGQRAAGDAAAAEGSRHPALPRRRRLLRQGLYIQAVDPGSGPRRVEAAQSPIPLHLQTWYKKEFANTVLKFKLVSFMQPCWFYELTFLTHGPKSFGLTIKENT